MNKEQTIHELETYLKELKLKESKEKWTKYLNKLEKFLKELKGKVILRWISNGGFLLYKVEDYKEQYYGDRNGAYGQWHPSRYFEVVTSNIISCRVADDRGNWFRPTINLRSDIVNTFRIFTNQKGKCNLSQIEVYERGFNGTVYSDIRDSSKVGFVEYSENYEDPDYSRALSQFLTFTYIVPESVLESALEVYNVHVQMTKNFWENNENVLKEAIKVSKIYESIDE